MGDEDHLTPGVSERCVTCGERIRAADRDELFRKYTDHQVEAHDRPRTVHDAGS